MTKLGIIGAMAVEIAALKENMENMTVVTRTGMEFYEGKLEGLPVVGVEAQATGLPVVTSTGVTRELPIEDLATYLPLTDTAAQWARVIQRVMESPRRDTTAALVESGYDVREAARRMQQRYEEMV